MGYAIKRILIDSTIYKDNLLSLKSIITFLCKDVAGLAVCLTSFELVFGDATLPKEQVHNQISSSVLMVHHDFGLLGFPFNLFCFEDHRIQVGRERELKTHNQ